MQRRIALRSLTAGLAMVSAAVLLSACSKQTPQFRAVDITGADYARDLPLTDQHGRVRSMAEFKGKVVVVFFGFTQCPDVCPTTLQELVEVKKLLGKDGDKVQGVFVTVDPERDTPEVLKAYMANFDPSFVALRGSPEQLATVAKDFKIYYKRVEGKTPTSYTMDHSAASYVFDTQGWVRLYTRYGSGAQALSEDIRLLLNN